MTHSLRDGPAVINPFTGGEVDVVVDVDALGRAAGLSARATRCCLVVAPPEGTETINVRTAIAATAAEIIAVSEPRV